MVFKSKKKDSKSEIKKEIKPISESGNFETMDINIVNQLSGKGILPLEVRSPFGERKVKLYVYDSKVKEVL